MNRAKLVRDKIPQIIRSSGLVPHVRVAEDEEYRRLLREKLREEVDEFLESEDPHELADVLEVLHALAGQLGLGFDGVEMIRVTKATERGAFAERFVWSGNSPTGARLELDEQHQFDGRAVG